VLNQNYPYGVVPIALAEIAVAAGTLAVGFAGGLAGFFLAGLAGSPHGQGPQGDAGPSATFGMLFAAPFCAGFLASAGGLLFLKRWSWFLSLAMLLVWLVGSLVLISIIYAFAQLTSWHLSASVRALLLLNPVLAGLSLWYLGRQKVRKSFGC